MADYHLSVKPVSRGKGRSATAAAAYRSAVTVHDQRTGEVHDYSRKRGVEHSEIVLPTAAAKRDINWPRDRQALWNAAERAENRSNSRVAREYELALPHEMNRAQRVELVRAFSLEIANRYGVAVDFALHRPHRKGDERNFHAHVLSTTRVIEATGLGAKSEVEWSEGNRKKAGLVQGPEEIETIRARWTTFTNERLAKLGIDARIDHRSLKDQGIDREPTKHRGPAIAGILERGERSIVAQRWQQEANERLRLAKEAGQLEREHEQVRESVLDLSNDIAAATRERDRVKSQRLTPEQIREQARAEWRELRKHPDKAKDHGRSQGMDAGEDKDRDKHKDHGHSRDGPDDDYGI